MSTRLSVSVRHILTRCMRFLPTSLSFWITRRYLALRGEQEPAEALELIGKHFDAEWYLKVNPDVAGTGLGPVAHFLRHGLIEGRRPAPDIICYLSSPGATERLIGKFTWQRRDVWLCRPKPLPHAIVQQIAAQASHEPAVYAPGSLALPNLRQIDATDVERRDGVQVGTLFNAIGQSPSTVMLVGKLQAGSAEKYSADIAAFFTHAYNEPPLIIVTDQTKAEAHDWQELQYLQPYKKCRVVFWRETCRGVRNASQVLARLLNGIRAKHVIVIDSEVGLEAVATHGRGLSQYSELHCAFFDLGLDGLRAPYGARFPRRTLPFATALTDNAPTADILRKRYAGLQGKAIAVLPPRLAPCSPDVFTRRVEKRETRSKTVSGRKWLWISKIEYWEGTAALSALARMRPADTFQIHGPLEASLQELSLGLSNVTYHGEFVDVRTADLSNYDGFLFTGLVGGTPNIALEMSQHAIPMVLADIGGLRATFDDTAAIFVAHANSHEETACGFDRALARLEALSPSAIRTMILYAREQALAGHAPEVYSKEAERIFHLRRSKAEEAANVQTIS